MHVSRVVLLPLLFAFTSSALAFQGPPILGGGAHGKGPSSVPGGGGGGGGSGGGAPAGAGSTQPAPTRTPSSPMAPGVPPFVPAGIATMPWIPTPLNLTTESDDGWVLWWEYNKMEFLRPHRLGMWGFPSTGADDESDLAARMNSARAGLEPALLRALADPDLRIRSSATIAVSRVAGDDSVEPLLKLLEDPSAQVRERAILALGASGSRHAVRPLLALAAYGALVEGGKERVSPYASPLAIVALALGRRSGLAPGVDSTLASIVRTHTAPDRDAVVAAALIYQCLVPGPDFARLALEAADDATLPPAVRCRAVESLAHSSDSSVPEKLEKLLVGNRLDLRRSAALALATVPDPSVSPALERAFAAEADPLARGFILISIGRQGGEKAREFLLRVGREGESVMRKWAALGLGVLARSEMRNDIGGAIRELAVREKSHESVPAYWIAEGLARDAASLEGITAGLTGAVDPTQRMYAATALALLAGEGAEKALRDRIDAEDSALVRAAIASALGYLGRPEDAHALAAAMQTLRDPDLQGLTATALSFHGSIEAFQVLCEITNQKSGAAVRRAAAIEGLGMMLAPSEPLLLAEVSRAANYTVFPEWVKGLFQLTL